MKDVSKYSNLSVVKKRAEELLGKGARVDISTRKEKKFMIEDPITNKKVHFGQMGFQDYTKHGDEERRDRFRIRNQKWREAPLYSPARLAYELLW